MKKILLFCVIGAFILSFSFAADWFKSELVKGDPLGFRSLRSPVSYWNILNEDHRMTGNVSKIIQWNQVQEITVIYAVLHIRGSKDVEDFIKKFVSEGELISKLNENINFDAAQEDKNLSLQALLKFKNGKTALISISDYFVVIESEKNIGLKKKEKASSFSSRYWDQIELDNIIGSKFDGYKTNPSTSQLAKSDSKGEIQTITLEYRISQDAFAPSKFLAVYENGRSHGLNIHWKISEQEKMKIFNILYQLEKDGPNGHKFTAKAKWIRKGFEMEVFEIEKAF